MKRAIAKAYDAVKNRGVLLEPTRWQSMDVSKKPEAATYEVLNYTLQAQVTENLDQLRADVEPNLPWADDHFEERVSGQPLNPGVQWAHWPWGNSANSFRRVERPTKYATEAGFDHTYMERMWPKLAGRFAVPTDGRAAITEIPVGIRFDYGDADDVVTHLARAPHSRQAFLPIWFPEDTGKLDVRVPCTLGYHFIQRHGFLHCTYYIRSCDLYRHFRDDVYMTVRLQLWMLDRLRELCGTEEQKTFDWHAVKPGLFTMHVVSLHCFVNDYIQLFGAKR